MDRPVVDAGDACGQGLEKAMVPNNAGPGPRPNAMQVVGDAIGVNLEDMVGLTRRIQDSVGHLPASYDLTLVMGANVGPAIRAHSTLTYLSDVAMWLTGVLEVEVEKAAANVLAAAQDLTETDEDARALLIRLAADLPPNRSSQGATDTSGTGPSSGTSSGNLS
jgi:hypothetical protein